MTPGKLVLASSNAGKLRELRQMLPRDMALVPQSALGIADIVEEGDTFAANAIAKARNACRRAGLPAIADDSGLEVDALNGAPGVYSARYAGDGATDEENVAKLLEQMRDVPAQGRTARFRCVIALVRRPDDREPMVFEGVWQGSIQTEATGDSGFGYDPVFHVPTHGCSAAELADGVKNRLSHRGRAIRALMAVLARPAAARSNDREHANQGATR